MALEKLQLDTDGRVLENNSVKLDAPISNSDLSDLYERLDSLDYKLWELLKIANAFAKKHNLEIEENE